MNRRKFLLAGSVAAAGLAISKTALAEEEMAAKVPVNEEGALAVEISRNHGHNLELTTASILMMLRATSGEEGKTTTLSIQGRSRHPHTVDLNQGSLVDLLVDGVISLESSNDASHTHTVKITHVFPTVEVEEIAAEAE